MTASQVFFFSIHDLRYLACQGTILYIATSLEEQAWEFSAYASEVLGHTKARIRSHQSLRDGNSCELWILDVQCRIDLYLTLCIATFMSQYAAMRMWRDERLFRRFFIFLWGDEKCASAYGVKVRIPM